MKPIYIPLGDRPLSFRPIFRFLRTTQKPHRGDQPIHRRWV